MPSKVIDEIEQGHATTASPVCLATELNLAGAQQNEALSLVQLYNALGGGWQ